MVRNRGGDIVVADAEDGDLHDSEWYCVEIDLDGSGIQQYTTNTGDS